MSFVFYSVNFRGFTVHTCNDFSNNTFILLCCLFYSEIVEFDVEKVIQKAKSMYPWQNKFIMGMNTELKHIFGVFVPIAYSNIKGVSLLSALNTKFLRNYDRSVEKIVHSKSNWIRMVDQQVFFKEPISKFTYWANRSWALPCSKIITQSTSILLGNIDNINDPAPFQFVEGQRFTGSQVIKHLTDPFRALINMHRALWHPDDWMWFNKEMSEVASQHGEGEAKDVSGRGRKRGRGRARTNVASTTSKGNYVYRGKYSYHPVYEDFYQATKRYLCLPTCALIQKI